MKHLTEKDFDKAWKIFKDNKKWFPHVRESHVKIRLSRNQVILKDGVLTQEEFEKAKKKALKALADMHTYAKIGV